MDDFAVKLLMLYNTQFYALAIEALGQYVDMFLAQTNKFIREDWEGEDPAPQFDSLDELLYGSDYFGTDPESSRCEFVHVFQDVLWNYSNSSAINNGYTTLEPCVLEFDSYPLC